MSKTPKFDPPAKRRQRLLKLMKEAEVRTLLVTNVTNVTYLTGFTGDSSYLLLNAERALLLSDSRYTTQIEEECPDVELEIRPVDQKLVELLGEVLKKAKIRQLGFESHHLTVEAHKVWQEQLEDVELIPVADKVEELRMIKDAGEIDQTRQAVRMAERGFDFLKSSLKPELTELQCAHNLEHAMRGIGAEGVSFPPIIGVGDRAALPHYRPADRLIGAAPFMLIDWGAQTQQGYKSDLTRVLITGKPPAKLQKVYEVVLKAQQAAIEAIRPGAACVDIDAIARKVITDAGFGKKFGHGLGHGIGLDIHESPRFSPTAESELQQGMIVTIEPGIYLPSWGGVRIEDDVLVTADGCEVLSDVPKEFDEAHIQI